MKKIKTLLFLLLCSGTTAFCQNAIRDTGIINNAPYEIKIPAQWNKKLVMFAHGYEAVGSPRKSFNPEPRIQIFLDRGFAVARSFYSRDGWALPEGVNETESLRQYFYKKYGKPDSAFITGLSMGGGITIATMENLSKNYNGALAQCPLSTRPYEQTKIGFDSYAVFNVLFPGAMPSLADVMSGKAPEIFTGDFQEKVDQANKILEKAKNKDRILAEYAKHYSVKVEEIPFVLVFGEGVIRDIAAQLGGNPYDNTNTLYTGFPDDWDLNAKIERLPATVSANRLLIYDHTGVINKPVVMLHTAYDPIIAPFAGINNYDALVHEKHKEQNLKVFITNGEGHCNFTNEQVGTAFDALRAWTKSGHKPASYELSSPSNLKPDTLCYELRIYTAEKGKLNDLVRRFRNHTTKLFEKHGMTNVGYWTPIDNSEEKLYYVLSYPNRLKRDSAWANFSADTIWRRVVKESEVNGKIVSKVENVFLKTTDFSPNNFTNDNYNRVWEFRKYRVTPNNLGNLLDRFSGFTVKKFESLGMTNKIYWTDTAQKLGEDHMLYYFLTHQSPEAAKSAFAKFGADPDWIATRKASEVKGGGSLTISVESIYMYPTDFSKLK